MEISFEDNVFNMKKQIGNNSKIFSYCLNASLEDIENKRVLKYSDLITKSLVLTKANKNEKLEYNILQDINKDNIKFLKICCFSLKEEQEICLMDLSVGSLSLKTSNFSIVNAKEINFDLKLLDVSSSEEDFKIKVDILIGLE